MKRKKKLVKRIGCGLLVSAVAFSGVNVPAIKKVEARTILSRDSEGHKIVNEKPYGVTLRKLYKWCPFIDKTVYSADQIYDHTVYHVSVYEENKLIGTDREGNQWYGDCVSLQFGSPGNPYGFGGSMPVMVNVHCGKSGSGVTTGTFPTGCNITYKGEEVFAPAIEVGGKSLKGTSLEIVNLPETYMILADSAFEDTTTLKQVNFLNADNTTNQGKNLVHIGNSAFEGCSSLQNAILPE